MTNFGELKRLDPREVWPHEAADFTPWLAQNIERLGEALGMDLELLEREAAVGDFSLDLRARDLGTGRDVIIENQITTTDHDHLGKLLTYAAGFDAETVVWVATAFRDEHRQAIEWLNQQTGESTRFFAVEIEILQINDSLPAHNFKLVVTPNTWAKEKRRAAGNGAPTERGLAYEDFFQQVVDTLRDEHRFTKAKKGYPQNWYSFGSGIGGLSYSMSFARGGRFRAEVYIDTGDQVTNKRIFDRLASRKEHFERQFGGPLEWERLDERQACRIAAYRPGAIEATPEELVSIREWGIDRILRLKQVLHDAVRDEIAELVQ